MWDVVETSARYYSLNAAAGVGKTAGAGHASSSSGAAGANVSAAVGGGERFARNRDALGELCKRRFLYRQAFDIYGGVAGFFTYGPPGCAVKNNLIRQWRQHFVIEENLLEVEDTCIMLHAVLKASGHVDRFNDFMVKDVMDESKFFRADKLLEEVMEKELENPAITEEQRQEYTIVKNQADGYSKEEMHQLFQKYNIRSPESGNELSEPYEFNLMFPAPIGPGGYLQGYLRPETAQGIFLNYKFCCEQNSNRLPFGVAQVGRAFRNEIAPRAGLTRQREFTQAEIEYFVNPANKAHPKFKEVKNLTLLLFPQKQQLAAEEPVKMTVGDAVAQGIINNETLGYFISRTFLFLVSVGCQEEFVRFRQHLPTEMAHYASDCWDAEVCSSYGWLECVGLADRACFDLNAHARAARCDLSYKEALEKPVEKEVIGITKASGITIMKAFKKEGKMVKDYVEALSQEEMACLESDMQNGPKQVTIDEQTFEFKPEYFTFERKMEKQSVNTFTPGVIEPSFGIDRIFACTLEHVYYARAKEDEDEKQTRGVLKFGSHIAPYKCTILPLDQRIARHEKYLEYVTILRQELAANGLSYTMDESGSTVGKRYSRNDELGTPFAITMDFDTLEDGTATLRERDSMEQRRLPLKDMPDLLRRLCSRDIPWSEVKG
mmetsp:Transcript_51341/g.94876  ORF Transcript_51341/g.94876 Transcript_51341/m.94876 type:complete len:663 (+) Transcript_51341:69-2057(+)